MILQMDNIFIMNKFISLNTKVCFSVSLWRKNILKQKIITFGNIANYLDHLVVIYKTIETNYNPIHLHQTNCHQNHKTPLVRIQGKVSLQSLHHLETMASFYRVSRNQMFRILFELDISKSPPPYSNFMVFWFPEFA
ncbi:hypothetical protein P3G55_15905 [Leptospira sp. 96542]|nr:hypothetical protein [Leptospira sp. 96542]